MDSHTWNTLIAAFPAAHILQSWEWGQFKSHYGWDPVYKVWMDGDTITAASLILIRRIVAAGIGLPVSVMYLPKGPVLHDWGNEQVWKTVLADLLSLAHKVGAIFIKIDPDVQIGTGIPGDPDEEINPIGRIVTNRLVDNGWHFSGEQIQFRNTVLIDITRTEQELLANMKQKTRYNIRLAARKGVVIRSGTVTDLNLLYRMYNETSVRDSFVIRDEQYYSTLWESFMTSIPNNPNSAIAEPLIAEVGGEPVAAVIVFRFAGKAWYLFGMSTQEQRELMPNYLLQWEAIQRAKNAGCSVYDLWGAPDNFSEKDPLWGVFRFKEGLGGQVIRTFGAWDLPVRPYYYKLYTEILPRLLKIMRNRGKSRARQAFGE
jgi:peptidoglycan pentaglycine glycine transferase (the first glycine)